jgi:ATP-dependent DNA helicase RecG
MSIGRITSLLRNKENIHLEFKKAHEVLPSNLFESICAMLNREGGDILLGVTDSGEVHGVAKDHVADLISQIVNLSNNQQKIDPPFILFPQQFEIEGKVVIHVQIPESSQVHRTSGTVYDRSNDGDFKINQPERIAALYNRKRVHFSELTQYNAVKYGDLKEELFPKIRNLIRSFNPNHPWLELTNEQMLFKAGLIRRDPVTGTEAYTLAAVLLLGKDELIQNVLPFFKIDAIVRKTDIARYDDRDYIQCNLIEAYERLMSFLSKHLPDKFYVEKDQRVSLLNKIFREVVANFIVHREYTNASPATMIIYSDRVETINANNAHGSGIINPLSFSPFQKNPLIAKFFIQLGRVDELGSGILNVNKYLPHYSTSKTPPQFIEGDVFKTIIPLNGVKSGINEGINEGINGGLNSGINGGLNSGINGGLNSGLNEGQQKVFKIIRENEGIKAKEISVRLNIPIDTIDKHIKVLKTKKLIYHHGSKKTGGYFFEDKT